MSEEIKQIISDHEKKFVKLLTNYVFQLSKISAGKANPLIFHGIKINYFDSLINLEELVSINPQGPLQLVLKPYDLSIIKEIEKVIIDAKLPVQHINEGNQIRVNFPQMTTEKRKELVKSLSTYLENTKIALRKLRHEMLREIKNLNLSKDEENRQNLEVQKIIDQNLKKINEIHQKKEKDLLVI